MEEIIIQGTIRQRVGKGGAHELRQNGQIPAVFYGKGEDNAHFEISPKALEKAVAGKLGMNTLMKLELSNGKSFNVMLRDYQADAIKRQFTHADFISVDLKKKIHIRVPVHLEGRPEGVKEGGILEHITREIDVLCFPNKIPGEIKADVTGLKMGQNLHLSDIKLPEGVEPRGKADVTLAAVIAPREEVVATPEAAALAEPEVLTAKKEEGAAAGGDKGKDAGAKDAKSAKPAAKPAAKK